MNQTRGGANAHTAVLAGSLSAFSLLDVLAFLSRAGHVGGLRVVSDGVDEQLWVDDGDLLDPSEKARVQLFELACAQDAWFTVTAAHPPATTDGATRVSISALVDEIGPEVAEWRTLTATLPSDATVRMAPSMPADEIQVTADQWHVLSVIGTGCLVRDVVAAAGGRPLQTLRTLGALATTGLVSVDVAVRRPEPAPDEPRPMARRHVDGSNSGASPRGSGSPRRSGSADEQALAAPTESTSTRQVASNGLGDASEPGGIADLAGPRPSVAAFMPPPVHNGWPARSTAFRAAHASPADVAPTRSSGPTAAGSAS